MFYSFKQKVAVGVFCFSTVLFCHAQFPSEYTCNALIPVCVCVCVCYVRENEMSD